MGSRSVFRIASSLATSFVSQLRLRAKRIRARCSHGLNVIVKDKNPPILKTRLLALGFFLLISHSLSAQTNLSEKARERTVYINFQTIDPDNGVAKLTIGTGFVVSAKGHVLTASHIFRDWQRQNDASRASNPIHGTLRDKPGATDGPTLTLEMINPGNTFSDVALLKFPELPGKDYLVAPICFKEEPKLGDELYAFGFPFDFNFQPIKATLGTSSVGGRWSASSAFTYGMSGGPVYSASGFVVGIVKGGLDGTDAVRWITPISFAYNTLLPPFKESCPVTLLPVDSKTCRIPSHGVEKYQRVFEVTRDSGWRGGGYNQTSWCNDVIAALRGEHPQGIFAVTRQGERSESKCAPFNCPQYLYTCEVEVKTDPLYREQADAACP
jgi:S1-C subfamily serine protease